MKDYAIYEVENRDEFCAAIVAASQPTKREAKEFPFRIHLLGTTFSYTAHEGLTEAVADKMAKRIGRVSQKMFQPAGAI